MMIVCLCACVKSRNDFSQLVGVSSDGDLALKKLIETNGRET